MCIRDRVLITARDKNIAIAINQIVPFAKPDNMPTSPCFGEIGVSPVKPLITKATSVAAPIGIALAIDVYKRQMVGS